MKTKICTYMTALAIAIVGVLTPTASAQETVKSRIGDLSFTKDFENGYPTDETVKKLYDEMDFQRATQAYMWSIPLVGFVWWQDRHNEVLGTKNGQLAMLKPLGIEKGKPFKPNARQKKILMDALVVGEAMAKANDFSKRLEKAHYRDGSHWDFATTANWNQRTEYYQQLDGAAAWFYEAVSNDESMHGQETGWGQVYMGANKDADGDWLDGATNYILHVPANPPGEAFWSITLYDVTTRCLIQNDTQKGDLSSRQKLQMNRDGSVDLYFGPKAPKGKESNWVQTMPNKAWFPYFRLYSPTQPFLDQTWVLPDIEKAK